MGRRLAHVALDFQWPLKEVWKGYINVFSSRECPACEGSGYSPLAKRVSDEWYYGEDGGWRYHLTQDEVDKLVEESRLYDLTHKHSQETGWERDPDKPHPTAAQVNAWARSRSMGHDTINKFVCLEQRLKRVYGITGDERLCTTCSGRGHLFHPQPRDLVFNTLAAEAAGLKKEPQDSDSDGYWAKHAQEVLAAVEGKSASDLPYLVDDQGLLSLACNSWQRIEPPAGPGFQLWETTSEGSPVSPVFETLEALCEWLAPNGTTFGAQKAAVAEWRAMLDDGFVYHADGKGMVFM